MKHLAIIMDGNRRFAKKAGIPKHEGHKKGIEKLKKVLEWGFNDHKIEIITVYALSTENLKRDPIEVKNLLNLLNEYLLKIQTDENIHLNKIKVKIIGSTEKLPKKTQELIKQAEKSTEKYKKHRLNVCIAYGGQEEIRQMAGKTDSNNPTQKNIQANLYQLSNGKYTPVDLLLRTGGDHRISNFLLYHIAYAEINFHPKMFPELTKKDFDKVIKDFKERDRRFGR